MVSISANAQVENTVGSSTYPGTQGSCKCVVFRLDDVNSDFLTKVQLNVMDQFISQNQSISLGLIMHRIVPTSPVVEKVKEGQQNGLFELDLHGWDHVDYSQLSKEEQLGTLQQASDKMNAIFGQHSQVFIPPYNKFNGDTIGVLQSIGVRIFSSDTSADKNPYFIANGMNEGRSNLLLYHLPAMTSFKDDNGNGTWIKVPIQTILSDVDDSVNRYGYAVVLLHPQNFAKMVNNVFVDTVDPNEIKDLSLLMYQIKSEHLKITTFANVVGSQASTSSHVQLAPEFSGTEVIVLVASILLIVGFSVVRKNDLIRHRI
ncbi:MAG TPA: polysaccharide deacetylase family protein [Candidatus Nitrosotalea sp.]|nr:polysaccharide deacetylase family protein [Candidatus Nitrosotalea sp.]